MTKNDLSREHECAMLHDENYELEAMTSHRRLRILKTIARRFSMKIRHIQRNGKNRKKEQREEKER